MSTVAQLIESADCDRGGCVSWGMPVPTRAGGIYLIATTDDPDHPTSAPTAPLDTEKVQLLLDRRPELTIDGSRPSVSSFEGRLQSMWLPDEPAIYVGKAASIGSRVGQYYNTSVGARSPHAGGWPLKLLANLENLWVHWAESPMPELAEQKALAAFVHAVSESSRAHLLDPDHPYPYANLEGPGGRKRHGIRGARQPRGSVHQEGQGEEAVEHKERPALPIDGGTGRTQRVTQADLGAGRIRIPGVAKHFFPSERLYIDIRLRSEVLTVRWDPRFGPPAKSGTLGIGRAKLASVVQPNETLTIRRNSGQLEID